MKSCLEWRKIIGREDKSFVATVVVMPTITKKSIKIVLILCATLTTSCAKLSHSILLNTEGKSKPPELNYYKGFDFEFYQYFTNQNR
jgi:hypothetical protein